MTDLFGETPSRGQLSMFGDSENLIPHPDQPSTIPDPAKVREKLHALLEKVRNAETMPWPDKKARVWQIVFPNMANWLPEDEANQLRFEFAQEMERLRLAA